MPRLSRKAAATVRPPAERIRWLGEPGASDFCLDGDVIARSAIFDGRAMRTAREASFAAARVGLRHFIAPRPSRRGQDVYWLRSVDGNQYLCAATVLEYRAANSETKRAEYRLLGGRIRQMLRVMADRRGGVSSVPGGIEALTEALSPRVVEGVCEATSVPLDLGATGRPDSLAFVTLSDAAPMEAGNMQVVAAFYARLVGQWDRAEVDRLLPSVRIGQYNPGKPHRR